MSQKNDKTTGVYKTIVTVEVLSDKPLTDESLETIAEQSMTGDWSKNMKIGESVELSKDEVETECAKHGSDVSFFLLDDKK